MTNKVIIAGFGGQGIIMTGLLLAHAAMFEGKNVTHFPSYGAEMRGGTCNCSVIISDNDISSPVVIKPDILMVLNQPSKVKFEGSCTNNGKIFINNSLIKDKSVRSGLDAYYVDASNIASSLGSIKSANMVMMGSFCKATGIIKLESLINALPEIISKRNQQLIEINIKALKEGYNLN